MEQLLFCHPLCSWDEFSAHLLLQSSTICRNTAIILFDSTLLYCTELTKWFTHWMSEWFSYSVTDSQALHLLLCYFCRWITHEKSSGMFKDKLGHLYQHISSLNIRDWKGGGLFWWDTRCSQSRWHILIMLNSCDFPFSWLLLSSPMIHYQYIQECQHCLHHRMSLDSVDDFLDPDVKGARVFPEWLQLGPDPWILETC
jgi:hypothetical protein